MVIINKISGEGMFVDKKSLKEGELVKLVNEAHEEEGKFGSQIVANIKIKSRDGEPKFAINPPTVNALIEAFGEDSMAWCNKVLTIHIEKVRSAGRKGLSVYLIPENYDFWDDEKGYLVIGKKAEKPQEGSRPEINDSDIPF